ncbi:MAG: hypothetical protein U0V70_19100 [Terriglobia bacterium]
MIPAMKKEKMGRSRSTSRRIPRKDKESNWLPALDGPIYLVMRLYWPKTEPPSIFPPGQGTWNPPPWWRSSRGSWRQCDFVFCENMVGSDISSRYGWGNQ